jgi:hypothetical protein
MTEENLNIDTNNPVNNNNNTPVNEDEYDINEESDINSWTASGPMVDLPTEVYRGNILEPLVRKQILQAEPRNKQISFVPLKMEQRMLNVMPKSDKETDKNFSKLLYRFSAAIRLIDNTLRIVYATKPEEESGERYDTWVQLEQTVLNSRALVLDALSFGNDLRRELALKNLSPNYKRPTTQRGVFGDDLSNLVKDENELNKLFNDAAYQRRRASSFQTPQRQPKQSPSISYSQRGSYRGKRGRGSSTSTQSRPQQYQGNSNPGDSTNC